MLLYTAILAYFINLIAAFRTKQAIIIPALLIVVAFVIMGFVPATIPDYAQYSSMYYTDYSQIEKGYAFFSKLFLSKGFEYSTFRLVCTIIGLIVMSIGVYRFTHDLSKFWAIYILFPFFMDIIQIRNFLMMSFVILASSFLVNINFKNVLLFLIFTTIGSSFQSAGYFFYIPLIFLLFRNNRVVKKLFVGVIGLFCFLSLISRSIVYAIIAKATSIIGAESVITTKLSNYTNDSVNFGFLPYWILIILSYFIVRYSMKNILNDGLEKANLEKLKVIEAFSLTSLVSLPLIMVSLDFYRISRNVFPLVIIAFVITSQYMNENKIKHPGYKILFSLTVILNIIIVYRVIWINAIFPVIFNNTLF